MKKITFIYVVFISLLILATSLFSFSQITFQKQIRINGTDWGMSVKQTADEGYIICGWTNSSLLLIKTNMYGDTVWTKELLLGSGIMGNDVVIADNGDYVVTGIIWDSNSDLFIGQFNSNGDTIWTRKFGGSRFDGGYSVCKAFDGGFVATGQTWSFGDTIGDLYILKVNENGIMQWQKNYGSNGTQEWAYAIKQTIDSGFIIAGKIYHLLKTNENGDTTWTKNFDTLSGCGPFNGNDVLQTNDGGYIISGCGLIKTNYNGSIEWNSPPPGGRSITQSNDGGYVSVKWWYDIFSNRHTYILKQNSQGDSIWRKDFGFSIYDDAAGYDIEKTSDNGYVITGLVNNDAGQQYVMLIKTNENGIVGINDYENLNSFTAEVFPNPFTDYTNIKIKGIVIENAILGIYNILGKLVRNIEDINGNKFFFYRNNLSSGIYFYKLTINNNYTINGKFIIK